MDRTVEVPAGFTIEFEQEPHDYKIDKEEVPSVTTITGMVGGAGGLPWWAQGIGVGGVVELIETGFLGMDESAPALTCTADDGKLIPATAETIVPLLTKHKLTVNHVRDKAGDRGTDVHVAAQRWAQDGEEPDPLAYPEEQMGYVRALQAWLTLTEPRVIACEQIVGSKILGYAGTLDLRCIIDGRVGIVDYKTSTSIRHPQYDYQLAGYELASRDSGYGETDFRAVLRLDKEGTFEWYESTTEPMQFVHALAIWYEDRRIKEFLKAQKKVAKGVQA